MKFAHAHGAKLVYAGSSSKFGNDGQDENLSPYAWTKAKNVEYIENFSRWYGLDYVITYFYNVYGPRQIREGRYATVIGIFEAQVEKGEPLTIVAPGTQTRDFTHIDDIVDGIVICAELGFRRRIPAGLRPGAAAARGRGAVRRAGHAGAGAAGGAGAGPGRHDKGACPGLGSDAQPGRLRRRLPGRPFLIGGTVRHSRLRSRNVAATVEQFS